MPASNIRVSDLAKQVGMEPAELLPVLRDDFGHRVRTASSSIPATEARKVINRLRLKKARASRADRDRKSEARANIQRLDEQKRLREAAREKERIEAEQREREEAERLAKEEAERLAREEEERLRREEAERVAARLAAEEAERRRAESAARAAERAAAAREAEAAAAAASRRRARFTGGSHGPDGGAPGRRRRWRLFAGSCRFLRGRGASGGKRRDPAAARERIPCPAGGGVSSPAQPVTRPPGSECRGVRRRLCRADPPGGKREIGPAVVARGAAIRRRGRASRARHDTCPPEPQGSSRSPMPAPRSRAAIGIDPFHRFAAYPIQAVESSRFRMHYSRFDSRIEP